MIVSDQRTSRKWDDSRTHVTYREIDDGRHIRPNRLIQTWGSRNFGSTPWLQPSLPRK